MQRPGKLHQVAHDRPLRQGHQVHPEHLDAGCPQHIHDRNGVRVRRHQHRHARLRRAPPQLADARGNRARLGIAVAGKQAQLHACVRRGRPLGRQAGGHTGAEGDRPGAQLVGGGKHLRKHLVAPVDECGRGAEIAREPQRCEAHVADSMLARADEQADLRVTEAVDRLHRIAHDEQRAPIALLPGRGQRFEQLELRQRGVLELIDQNVGEGQAGAQRELRGEPCVRERRARRTGDVGVIDAPGFREFHVQLARRVLEHARQRRDRRLVRRTQGRRRQCSHGLQQPRAPRYAAQLRDAGAQRLARRGRRVLGSEQLLGESHTPAPAGQRAVCEALPGGKVPGIAPQRSDAGELLRGEPQRGRQTVKGRRQVIADDVGETRVDARAQLPQVGLQHVAQPVSALSQHVREQPLDVVPMVVETLEQQLGGCAEHGIGLRGEQRAARRTPIQLPRRLGDPQRAAGAGGDRQLAREPIGERVDGLDSQRARVLLEIPAARRAMAQRRRGERAQLPGARVIGCTLPAQRLGHAGAHLGRGLAREGDGEDRARLVHRAQQAQEALREHGGLAGSGRRLQQDRALRVEGALAGLGIGTGELIHRRPRAKPRVDPRRPRVR